MLKRKLCEARFDWELICKGPLLIADGRYDYDQARDMPHKVFISHDPHLRVIESLRNRPADNLGLQFYVPGTSLRGPFRAQAERLIRSLLAETAPLPYTACDPLEMKADPPGSCSKRIEKAQPAYPYAAACPACKLFGCTGTASRIRFTDADLPSGCGSVYRYMIGIDRFTGGVGAGPMKFHALENTRFKTTVTVTNFELWQLGLLLAYVFRDFQDGLVPIGFGKTKGFGLVQGEMPSVMLTYPNGKADGKTIQHLGSLSPEEQNVYGLDNEAAPAFELQPDGLDGLGYYQRFAVDPTKANDFWAAAALAFNRYVERLAIQVAP